jgi:antitoxin component YwqK of YwqJK toxin-antitoxin module
MKIIITEEQKKKLFIPRRLSGENSRFIQWNKEQPIVDGVQINQYTHDGKKTGIWETYYRNGQLNYRGSFKDGEQDGIWEYYYKGQLLYKGSFNNGKKDGIWEKYWDNGQLMSKQLYKDDELIEELPLTESEQSKKGKLFIPRRLSGENSRFIQWNKEQPIVDGVQINQFTHDGKKDGIWERYYFNGQLQSRGSYENDIKEGYWESYWSNGQLWSKGTYKNGKRDGIWEEYFSDGEFWYEGEWNNDKYIRDIRI